MVAGVLIVKIFTHCQNYVIRSVASRLFFNVGQKVVDLLVYVVISDFGVVYKRLIRTEDIEAKPGR